jgi:hypothetical protein
MSFSMQPEPVKILDVVALLVDKPLYVTDV